MDSMNAFEIIPGQNAVECSTNLKTDEDSTKIQTDEVPNKITTNNPKSSDGKVSKKSTKEGKLSLKRKKLTKKLVPLKRIKTNSLPISQMVMESIKALRKRNGASVEVILEYMEGQYKVDAKLVKRYVTRFLLSAVQKGIVEQISGFGGDGRFKIKKAQKITQVEKKLKPIQKMVKREKVARIGQKLKDDQKDIKAEKVAMVE